MGDGGADSAVLVAPLGAEPGVHGSVGVPEHVREFLVGFRHVHGQAPSLATGGGGGAFEQLPSVIGSMGGEGHPVAGMPESTRARSTVASTISAAVRWARTPVISRAETIRIGVPLQASGSSSGTASISRTVVQPEASNWRAPASHEAGLR